jgi:hypothetical protein
MIAARSISGNGIILHGEMVLRKAVDEPVRECLSIFSVKILSLNEIN